MNFLPTSNGNGGGIDTRKRRRDGKKKQTPFPSSQLDHAVKTPSLSGQSGGGIKQLQSIDVQGRKNARGRKASIGDRNGCEGGLRGSGDGVGRRRARGGGQGNAFRRGIETGHGGEARACGEGGNSHSRQNQNETTCSNLRNNRYPKGSNPKRNSGDTKFHHRNRRNGQKRHQYNKFCSTKEEDSFDSTENGCTDTTLSTTSVSSQWTDSEVTSSNTISNELSSNKSIPSDLPKVLPWPKPHFIPVNEETRLLPALLHWGATERGMMKDQPPFRLKKIQFMIDNENLDSPKVKSNSKTMSIIESASVRGTNQFNLPKISLIQSLSLRRHHLKLLNPTKSMSALRLGSESDIREAARLFEVCLEEYFIRNGLERGRDYLTEEDQKALHIEQFNIEKKVCHRGNRNSPKQPPTPDFRIKDEKALKISFICNDASQITHCSNKTDMNQNAKSEGNPPQINWIEAKMFYGASTIPSSTPNAVGCILPKAQEYVTLYGTGAIVFMYGCGEKLAYQLQEVGVVALDGQGLDLKIVEDHQRGWCADKSGNILF